jgi:hypothetical protein
MLPLLTAKPTISVDYIAEYNKLTKPRNYNSNDNAAPYYQKAFEALVDIPEDIKDIEQAWPGDMNETELNVLRTWLSSNSDSLRYLKEASQKPYCWFQRQSADNAIFDIEPFELSKLRGAIWCFSLEAKLSAYQGSIDHAFYDVFDLHKIGMHYSGPVTLVEQLVGIAICQIAFNTTYQILDRTDFNPESLAVLQSQFEQQLQEAKKLNFSVEEEVIGYDAIQRSFTDDGNGDGRLIPGKIYKIRKDSPLKRSMFYIEAILICLNHPGRRETLQLHKELYRCLEGFLDKTPWQLLQDGKSYESEIKQLTKGNLFVGDSADALAKVCEIWQKKKISGDALITILAVLRYKADTDLYPFALQELVESGYMKHVPIDPYSGKPLVYNTRDENFTLYSIGANFTDNGGVPSEWGEGEEGGDQVFWPVERY